MVNDSHDSSNLVRIIATEDSSLALENLSSFLYDLVLVHDRLFLFYIGDYRSAAISGLPFNRRNGRRINKSEKLQVPFISRQSPLVFVVDIPGALLVALLVLTLIQILKLLSEWNKNIAMTKLDKQLKEEQLRRLIRENAQQQNSSKHTDLYLGFENSLIKDITRLSDNEQIHIRSAEIVATSQQEQEEK